MVLLQMLIYSFFEKKKEVGLQREITTNKPPTETANIITSGASRLNTFHLTLHISGIQSVMTVLMIEKQ